MNKSLIGILAILLSSCATPPKNYQYDNSVVIKDSYDNTWSKLVEHFASRNIQIKNVAKDSGIIAAEKSSFSSEYADCGNSSMIRPISNIAHFNVFVKNMGGSQTVSVNSNFVQNGISAWDSSLVQTQCNSTGKIEKEIINAIQH